MPAVRPAARPAVTTHTLIQRRALSLTPVRQADAEEEDGADHSEPKRYYDPAEVIKDMLREPDLTPEQRESLKQTLSQWDQMAESDRESFSTLRREIYASTAQIRFVQKPKKDSFWNEEEKDSDLITDEIGEDEFEEDDILSVGHAKLEEHREAREYARIAVWEMPLLSSKESGPLR